MNQLHDPKQQNTLKPMFDLIDSSMVRAQFVSKRDVSFSSYLHPTTQDHQNKFTCPQITQIRAEDSDQISIFDAAKYFSGLHDDKKDHQQAKGLNHLASLPPRLSSVSSSIDDTGSNYGGRNSNCTSNNYRARSFHATPTASSEASWNSQTGLLANPPGSIGISIAKNLSPNSSTNSTTSNVTPRWPRISTKWLISRRKCPCSGKKSVQVEERIESNNTPRMVDLRRSASSNGSATNYISSSWYSPRQNSPKKVGTIPLITSPNVVQVVTPRNNLNFNLNPTKNQNGRNMKEVGPLKSFNNHSEITSSNSTSTTNGFTFPILENPPVGVKKMFNVIAEPPRDSLEVFQPRSNSSPKSRRMSYEDENVLSDGSSDLFEIESFSTTYPCRDSMEDEEEVVVVVPAASKRIGIVCSSSRRRSNVEDDENNNNNNNDEEAMTPSECYAPSEVSIDWSVTTAEGFDKASLTNFSVSASEIGVYAAMRRNQDKKSKGGGKGNSGSGSGSGNGNGNGLLSCRCEKAVSVGPVPIKCTGEGGPLVAGRHVHVGGRPTPPPHANGRWK